MKYQKLLELAKPYLEKNDMGAEHTIRVLGTAKKNYSKYNLNRSEKDIILSLAVLHDIGGPTIKQQYDKGPKIAKKLLEKLKYCSFDINLICKIISIHHNRLDNPSDIFKILYDSDHLVMFSEEEFPYYDLKPNFNWKEVIDSIYHDDMKVEAKELLEKRCYKNG